MANLFLSFILTFFIVPSHTQNGDLDEKLHVQCIYPTVLVRAGNEHGYGTGVIVRSTKIAENRYANVFVTAAHVVKDMRQCGVAVFKYKNWSDIEKNNFYSAIIYGDNPSYDLAIGIFITDTKMPAASINMNPQVFIGSDVFHMGCGLKTYPRLDYGKITTRNIKGDDDHWLMRTSVYTVPGDSGGPLFSKYQVIGFANRIKKWNDSPVFGISYYVPTTCLQEWNDMDGGGYEFAWRSNPLPVLAYWRLNFAEDYAVEEKKPH